MLFVPAAIGPLSLQHVKNATLNRLAPCVSAGQQAHNRPRSLGRSTWPNTARRRIVIRSAGFAPSTVGVLHHAEPFDRLLHIGLMVIDADGLETAKHLHRPINVVDAPAAKPGAIGFLLAQNELDRFGNASIILGIAVARQ